ncbi:MAG: hypothetical protein ACRENZ_02250 [Thermodesulfobacteriota bacterium]
MKAKVCRSFIFSNFILLLTILSVYAQDEKGQIVIEESYYLIRPENQYRFLEIIKDRVYPFWMEMKKIGIIDGDFEIYTQRVHTFKPKWTYKSVVRFKNYASIDKWLKERDNVVNKLFPNQGGYEGFRKEISLITEEHWDELIREIPLY